MRSGGSSTDVTTRHSSIADIRFRLSDRLLPIAFSPENAGLASRCQAYRAGWKRLLPGWWRLKGELAILYGGRVPETPVLIEDMARLADYHRRIDYVRQVKHQYADRLLFDASGELDRGRTLEGLRVAEQIDPLVGESPHLKEIVVNSGRVDRVTLRTDLDQLASLHRLFVDSVARSGAQIDLGAVFSPEGRLSRITTSDLAGWLNDRLCSLEARSVETGRLVALLKPGRDVPLADLPSRLQALDEIVRSSPRVTADYLVLIDDVEMDREATEEGMRAAEKLDPLVRGFPELRDILVEPGRIDRVALKDALKGLGRSYGDFRDSMARSAEQVDLGAVFNPEGRLSRISTADFAGWLQVEISDLEARVARTGRLCGLLKPGGDVRAGGPAVAAQDHST